MKFTESGGAMAARLRGHGENGVPILLYHRVSDQPLPGLEHYCVSPGSFRRQMQWLKARGYETISLDRLLGHYLAGDPLPRRPVIITFDDGYKDNLDNAYPVLESLGLAAVIFLVAGWVGRDASWDSAFGRPPRLLSWEEIRLMAGRTIHFGGHTVNHPHLCQLPSAEARNEIQRCKAVLEDRLGFEISSFAYPFSDLNTQLRDYVAQAGYRTACSSIWGVSTKADDVYALRRLIVGGGDSMETFANKLGAGSSFSVKYVALPALRRIKRLLTRGASAGSRGVGDA